MLRSFSNLSEARLNKRYKEKYTSVQESLRSVENAFRKLANRTSLVIRDAAINFLFTGDIDDSTLDRHYLLEAMTIC